MLRYAARQVKRKKNMRARVVRNRKTALHAATNNTATISVQMHISAFVQLTLQEAIDTSWHMMV